ncbi:HEAT repeat domain-containing protein [Poriferisphaera sp. WC338]|uniref:HEAT repeat domain-containing protein n=1 Tax=Poriferisphaera sp. WC338 TaxID=3425129 RepID=UPI003D81768B
MQRPFALMLGASILSLNLIGGQITSVSAQDQQDPKALWADFNHYVLIAHPDLAEAAGETLLKSVDNAQLLKIVENSDYADGFDLTIIRASKVAKTRDIARKIEQRIQAAKIEVSRDNDRIAKDIQMLGEGQRPNRNAVARLTSAGQFAAPQLLETLRDDSQANLHAYVIDAMKAIGKPMVAPLATAMPSLEPVQQIQVAQVLHFIGYPQSLPQLKEVLESADTDPKAREVVQLAFVRLADEADISPSTDAATLYLMLGQECYDSADDNSAIAGYDASNNTGVLWKYTDKLGLLPMNVPGEIYADVLAMRNAKRSLELNENLDAALSLYLSANFRRENKLPVGADDPSYPTSMKGAEYYAMLAGPDRVQDVLASALADRDSALALDAIQILADTAGTDALVNRGSAIQPLLDAVSFPDRRVRFAAATTLANARPDFAFPGSFRIVPVLAEAIRQGDVRSAVVIAKNQDTLNELVAALEELGYDAFGGFSLADVQAELNAAAGVDLMLTNVSPADAVSLYNDTLNNYKLGAVPVLIQAAAGNQVQISEWAANNARAYVTSDSTAADDLRAAVEAAGAAYEGGEITEEEATDNALDALAILYDLALGSKEVYNTADAQPALIEALGDPRVELVEEAARVLALLNSAAAQQAIADAALSATSEEQLSLLSSLSVSATYHGNKLKPAQVEKVMRLVAESDGDLAVAAARAHGALSLPTADAVSQILK